MTEDEYLLALARAITSREDLIAAEVRPILLELALRIRALLFQSFGQSTSQPLRALLYSQLRPQILTLLQQLADRYFAQISITLPELYPILAATHTRFARVNTTIPTPPLGDLLTGATVLNRSARDLLAPGPTGISPLTLQLERLLDTTIQPALLRETATGKILASVIAVRTSNGTETGTLTPLVRKGTVLNAWLDRLGATTAALLWSLNDPIQQEVVREADDPPDFYRWNAILDPKTCPICIPLDGTTAPTPQAFPNGAPPVHPRCRCITVPVFS
jgi:hypothetical protein